MFNVKVKYQNTSYQITSMLTLHSNISTISSNEPNSSISMQGIKLSSYSDVVKNTMLSSVRKRMISIEDTVSSMAWIISNDQIISSLKVHASCIDSILKNIKCWRQNNDRAEIYAAKFWTLSEILSLDGKTLIFTIWAINAVYSTIIHYTE